MSNRIITNWGYDVIVSDDVTALPDLVTPADIALASNGRIAATDSRLPAICAAVSGAIRDYCAWHVAPVLSCELLTQVDTRIITLPAKLVTSLDSIEVEGEVLDPAKYEWKRAGLVRLHKWPHHRGRWGAYKVAYDAGMDASASPLAQVAAQVALNSLMATPGVRNESVGQVSLSYNQLTDGVSGGVQLLDRDRSLLRQYRIQTKVR